IGIKRSDETSLPIKA
ncbi:unnamed protein product, partial [Adineta steineri]